MRIIFAASPSIAVPSLEFFLNHNRNVNNYQLAGLLTNPDSPKGRSGKPEPTECAVFLQKNNAFSIPVLKPENLDNTARERIMTLKPDMLVSFAYGKIFGHKFLSLFPLGGINIHPSLLPKYRGPSPIPAAIINNETVTGITVQQLAEKMDCGDILFQETISLDGRETTASLNEKVSKKAARILPSILKEIIEGTIQPKAQDDGAATYCPLITKEDGLINWSQSAEEIDAKIRAFTPWPLSWTYHEGFQVFILKADIFDSNDDTHPPGKVLGKDKNSGILIQCGKGIIAATELQYKTKKALNWKDFINGAKNFIGTRLGA